MSLIAVLEALEGEGVDAKTMLAVVRAHEAARQAEVEAKRAKAAEKKRRQRAALSPIVPGTSGDIGGQAGTNGDGGGQPLSLPLPPQTPPTPTHTRVSINTRERENGAFERFWTAYPRKVSKADARKAFGKAWAKLPPHDEEAIIVGGLERAKAAWTDAQFIPHAATWLNGERWNDEPATVTPLRPHDQRHPHQAQSSAREDRLGRMLRGAMAAADRHDDELDGRRAGTGG